MMHRHLCRGPEAHCDSFSFDITHVKNKLTSTEVQFALVSIEMDFGDSDKFKHLNPVAYITSEANAFGVVGSTESHNERWYDGVVERIDIGQNNKLVEITQVQQTIKVGRCSKQSYYEILADR